jgi:hypothetical protein
MALLKEDYKEILSLILLLAQNLHTFDFIASLQR